MPVTLHAPTLIYGQKPPPLPRRRAPACSILILAGCVRTVRSPGDVLRKISHTQKAPFSVEEVIHSASFLAHLRVTSAERASTHPNITDALRHTGYSDPEFNLRHDHNVLIGKPDVPWVGLRYVTHPALSCTLSRAAPPRIYGGVLVLFTHLEGYVRSCIRSTHAAVYVIFCSAAPGSRYPDASDLVSYLREFAHDIEDIVYGGSTSALPSIFGVRRFAAVTLRRGTDCFVFGREPYNYEINRS